MTSKASRGALLSFRSGFPSGATTRNRALCPSQQRQLADRIRMNASAVGHERRFQRNAHAGTLQAQVLRCEELLKETQAKSALVREVAFGIGLHVCVKRGDFDAANRVFDEL